MVLRGVGPRLALFFAAGVCLPGIVSGATFVVNSAGDQPDADTTDGICRTAVGTCTLRAAIEQANASPGADTIAFDIAGSGVHTISPASPLPPLTDDAGVLIDGYTQPGATPNTLAIGDDAVLRIELDGTGAGANAYGLTIQGIGGVVRGLTINRFTRAGLAFVAGYNHRVTGCFVGTAPDGRAARPNRLGIELTNVTAGAAAVPESPAPQFAIVGGLAPSERNLVSGNVSTGVAATSLTMPITAQGNYIGTDVSGTVPLPNGGGGISLLSLGSVIGGGDVFAGASGANVISGNTAQGVIVNSGAGNRITGNFIGTDPTGTMAVPNTTGINLINSSETSIDQNLISGNLFYAIHSLSSTRTFVGGNRIGTALTGSPALANGAGGILVAGHATSAFIGTNANLVAFNGGPGIAIGTFSGDLPSGISVFGNSIHDNAGIGIDLGNDGVTPNNDCDPGRGPNLGQNYPVLTTVSATPGGTTIGGSLNSVPNTLFTIEFFASPRCDPSGHGQGETFLGVGSVTTDSTCNGSFAVTVPSSVPPGSFITATATDPAGNTSEFSACIPASGLDFYTVAPCRVADTRGTAGPFGGPALSTASDRTFPIAGQCGIPADAQAVAFNFTVTATGASGDVQILPAGTPLRASHALAYSKGQTRAKNSVLALGAGGAIGTHLEQATGTTDLIIDVTGYFR